MADFFSASNITVGPKKYKNTKNNYENVFFVDGELKSLSCFPLNIDLHDILNYCINYFILVALFLEIAMNYGSCKL